MTEPVLAGDNAQSNVYGEHVYKVRATFGSSSAVTYRSLGATIAKTTTTTFTVTLPKPYAEITSFQHGWKSAASTATPGVKIITNNVATDGTLVLETSISGTPTVPNSGEVLYLVIGVSCEKLNDLFTG